MENEKGLDLSLGLPCGGNSSSQKDKHDNFSDTRLGEEGDRDVKLINNFKFFLEGGNQQHPLKVGENLYSNLAKTVVDLEACKNLSTGGIWLTNDSMSIEIEGEKRSSVGEKRKDLFIETNQQKKHESNATNHFNLSDKTKVSHISITTDEGSTADNEDIAESEADGSTSRHVYQLSMAQGESHTPANSSGVEILGQKRFIITSGEEFNTMNTPTLPYCVPFPGRPVNMNTSWAQPIKDSKVSCLSSYPLPSMIHGMGTNGERPGNPPVMPANFPAMFGYTSGRNSVNPDSQNDIRKPTQVSLHKSSEPTQYDDRAAAEHRNNYGKQQAGEEGSSSHAEGDPKGNPTIHHVKDSSDQPHPGPAESLPCEFPAIKPGIAADLKFGGCGSYPNLPWVSTTGQGPNGQTISGVTYRYSPTQIRIVCACHGSHMSPEEFVSHASAEENNVPDAGNPAASAAQR